MIKLQMIILSLLVFSLSVFLFYSSFFKIRPVLSDISKPRQEQYKNIFDQLYADIYFGDNDTLTKFVPLNHAANEFGMNPIPTMQELKFRNKSWLPSRFSNSILYLIDALRFDFMIFVNETIPPFNPNYHNVFPAIYRQNKSFSTFQSIFIADPPTTSQQRISSIASGTLPNFVEAAFNFAMIENIQDNILKQAQEVLGSESIYFFGDSTWTSLFPSILSNTTTNANTSYIHDFQYKNVHADYSFHVYDLDTVDRNIIKRVTPFLSHHNHSRFLLICHFLGIDHCGHKHGPNSKFMSTKMQELDAFVQHTKDKIDDSTIFFVFGDHGMTDNGDHGGSSLREISAGFSIFSRQNLTIVESLKSLLEAVPRNSLNRDIILAEISSLEAFYSQLNQLKSKTFVNYDFEGLSKFVPNASSRRLLSQIDFNTNFCLLAGFPIPFSSLGIIIPELYFSVSPAYLFSKIQSDPTEFKILMKDFRLQNGLFLLRVVRLNLLNMIRYFKTLSISKLPGVNGDVFFNIIFPKLEQIENELLTVVMDDELNVENIESFIVKYFSILTELVKDGRLTWTYQSSPLLALSIILFFILLIIIIFPNIRQINIKPKYQYPLFLVVLSALFYFISPFSNSFILYEYNIIRYVLSSLSLLVLYYKLVYSKEPIYDQLALFILLLILKSSFYVGACREEHEGCHYISREYFLYFISNYPSIYFALNTILLLSALKLCSKIFVFRRLKFAQVLLIISLVFIRWSLVSFTDIYGLSSASRLFSAVLNAISKIIYTNFFVALFFQKEMVFFSLLSVVLTLLRPLFGIFTFFTILILTYIIKNLNFDMFNIPISFFVFFSSIFLFFTSGHQFCFSTIHWEVAFYGFLNPCHMVSAIFLLLNIFGPSFTLALLTGKKECVYHLYVFFLVYSLSSMAVCLYHHNHLMFWAVFVPKFIYMVLFTYCFGFLSLFVSFFDKSTKH